MGEFSSVDSYQYHVSTLYYRDNVRYLRAVL